MAGRKNNGSKWIRPEKRQAIYADDSRTCQYCGHIVPVDSDEFLTLDHVVPRELGGSNKATNLVTACLSCNSSKRALPVAKFIAYLEAKGVDASDIARNVSNSRRRHAKFERRGNK